MNFASYFGGIKWVLGIGIPIVFAAASLIAWDFQWRSDLSVKVAPIPLIQEDIKEIKDDFSSHVGNGHLHPNLDRLSTQIENMDRRLQERAVVVDKKLDSIEATTSRQWQAISEIRKEKP